MNLIHLVRDSLYSLLNLDKLAWLMPWRIKWYKCVWFSFYDWDCDRVQLIYAQKSTIKTNFSYFL
jgi:hypothetical protein